MGGVYNTSACTANWRGYTLNGNTGLWTETADTVLANFSNNATQPCHRTFMYRNVMYWLGRGNGSNVMTLTFDPGASSLGAFQTNGLGANNPTGCGGSTCIFNDRLFLLDRPLGGPV